MLKILIADSDNDSIKNFQTYIKNSFPEIKDIYATSDNTKEFLETVKVIRPHFIIADIKFFGVGSFQKIKSIYERFPDIRFILYGTYNDTEYMRKSIEFGVIDYMYRPIKPAEFHRCMDTALDYFRKMEDNKKKEAIIVSGYKEKKQMFEDIFLKGLLAGHFKDNMEINYTFKYFGFDLKPDYSVFVVHIDQFKKIILTLDEMEKHVLIYKILLLLEKKLKNRKSKAFIGNLSEINVILSGVYDLEKIVEICEDIKDCIRDEMGIRVTIGIGSSCEFPTEICRSYREALGALRYRFHMGYNSVIHILFVEPMNNITYRYPIERELRLIHTAAIGEYDYSVSLLRELFDSLRECEPLPEMYLSKVIMNILISINRYLGEQNIKTLSPFTTFFASKEVLELGNDLDVAFEYLSNALKNFCGHIVTTRDENNKALVDKAKEYVDKKYYEAFSLSKVATELSTTPEYLNKIFKELENKTLFEYVLGTRILEAKRLMRETPFDDEIVAIKVGYDDAKHFRSIFKKHEGVSTNEYRGQFNIYHNNLVN